MVAGGNTQSSAGLYMAGMFVARLVAFNNIDLSQIVGFSPCHPTNNYLSSPADSHPYDLRTGPYTSPSFLHVVHIICCSLEPDGCYTRKLIIMTLSTGSFRRYPRVSGLAFRVGVGAIVWGRVRVKR